MKKDVYFNALWLKISLLFILSVIVRFCFCDYNKAIYIYPDELRYYSIAHSLFVHHSLEVYDLAMPYQKILYSLVIMPTFIISDTALRLQVITLINAVLISCGIFPVYLLARRFLKEQKTIFFCCLLYICSSDLGYSATFMSESLFLPMALWAVYLMVILIERTDNVFFYDSETKGQETDNVIANYKDIRKPDRRKYMCVSFFIGMYLWLLYLCKEIAAVFLIAYAVYVLLFYIKKSVEFKKSSPIKRVSTEPLMSVGLLFIGFALPFAVLKLTLFRGMGNSYDQQDMSVFSNNFNFYYMYYGFVYFLLMTMLAYTVFPFLVSIMNRKNMDRTAQHTFGFLLLLLVLSAAVISFTITTREDNCQTLPRVHLRYTCYLFMPLVIIMFASLESKMISLKREFIYFTAGVLAWFFYYFLLGDNIVVGEGVLIDQSQLHFLSRNVSTSYQLVVMIIYAAATAVCVFLVMRHHSTGTYAISIFLLVLSLVNGAAFSQELKSGYSINGSELKEAYFLESLAQDNKDKTFLAVYPYLGSSRIIDTYMQTDNVMQIRYSSLEDYIAKYGNKGVQWTDAASKLMNVSYDKTYDSLSHVDYIIFGERSQLTIDPDECTLVSGPEEYPKVYKINDPKHMPDIKCNIITITQNEFDAK